MSSDLLLTWIAVVTGCVVSAGLGFFFNVVGDDK